ncbi:Parkinson disease protein 7 homolog [Tubulanus polymorphus]|uniref:Parkinson disease protein 7 homolog n=1 Tax=Tubulanus polymorphus TaxID=672921 RepID=UPI003DA255F1
MAPTALVILAEGAEEMETVITVDILRRGSVSVTVAGLDGSDVVKCSRDVLIKPDEALDDVITQKFDAIVIPGGLKGAKSIAESPKIKQLLKKQESEGLVIAAICAGPLALNSHGIAHGKRVTSYPATKNDMMQGDHYTYCEDRVVVDGNIVTSRGPGTAMDFGLALVEKLQGKEKRAAVASPMLYSD